jgi:hypothetical protein
MRKILAFTCIILLVGLSGCLGAVSSEAPEPNVDQDNLDSTGYEFVDSEEIVYNQSLLVADAEAKSHLYTYKKANPTNTTIPLPESRYVVLSSPSVSPFGTELNPIVSDPTDRTFEKIEDKIYDSIEFNNKKDTINETHISGENITIEKYGGKIKINNISAQFDATVLSTVIDKEDSVLVAVGAYPVASEKEQQSDIITLMKNTDTRISED